MANATPAVIPVFGFQIKKFVGISGKGEEDTGKIQIVLEAPKDELRATDQGVNDILGAINMHHSTREAVAMQLRFD